MMETRYQAVVAVEHAIDEADPARLLEGGAPADEYSPEIGTIVPRLVNAQSSNTERAPDTGPWIGLPRARSSCLSQPAIRFQLALFWSTILPSRGLTAA